MKRESVDSSVIASIGYAPVERILELEFRETGDIYDCFDVPAEAYAGFRSAQAPISIRSSNWAATGISASMTPNYW